MDGQKSNNLITLPITAVREAKGLVVLTLGEYQNLYQRAMVATYCLEKESVKKIDQLVEDGLIEHKKGKTIKASCLRNALKIYDAK